MMRRRCAGGAGWRRLSRRFSAAAGSILPGVALILLPKCPMCLAVWLTVATGVGVSATAAAWARGALVVVWIAAVAIGAAWIVRRRALALRLARRAGCTCYREKLRTVQQGARAA